MTVAILPWSGVRTVAIAFLHIANTVPSESALEKRCQRRAREGFLLLPYFVYEMSYIFWPRLHLDCILPSITIQTGLTLFFPSKFPTFKSCLLLAI
jgi:hypothetical protein